MVFNLITAFPNFYSSFLSTSLVSKAISQNNLKFNIVDLKDFGIGKYKKVDDTPYGGGSGMVIRVDVVASALDSIENPGKIIALSPKGIPYKQDNALQLSKTDKPITLISGRYEGFDQRIFELVDKTFYIGEFITLGGEAPSLCIIESIIRLKKGVIGNLESTKEESFSKKFYKEYPIYTKPIEFNGKVVPKVLTSGNHAKIEAWRRKNAVTKKS